MKIKQILNQFMEIIGVHYDSKSFVTGQPFVEQKRERTINSKLKIGKTAESQTLYMLESVNDETAQISWDVGTAVQKKVEKEQNGTNKRNANLTQFDLQEMALFNEEVALHNRTGKSKKAKVTELKATKIKTHWSRGMSAAAIERVMINEKGYKKRTIQTYCKLFNKAFINESTSPIAARAQK